MPDKLTPDQREILDAARDLLVTEGVDALTIGRIAAQLGMRPTAIYVQFPDMKEIEIRLVAEGFVELTRRLVGAGLELPALARAYRGFALDNPNLYHLMMDRPLARDRLPDGLETRSAAPILVTVGDQDLARGLWGFAHGMVSLELADRFPEGTDIDGAWAALLAAVELPR